MEVIHSYATMRSSWGKANNVKRHVLGGILATYNNILYNILAIYMYIIYIYILYIYVYIYTYIYIYILINI